MDSGYEAVDFLGEVYPILLERLAKREVYYTKTHSEPNWVKVEDNKVSVMTEESRPDYREIQLKFFTETWDLLVEYGEMTQHELKENYNIKRSAFILIAFDLLDEVTYSQSRNSLRLRN